MFAYILIHINICIHSNTDEPYIYMMSNTTKKNIYLESKYSNDYRCKPPPLSMLVNFNLFLN